MIQRSAAVFGLLACTLAFAQGPRPAASAGAPRAGAPVAAGPALGQVLQESVTATPGQPGQCTRDLKPLPAGAYKYEDGEYRSGVSGVMMRLPQLRDEKVVSVREAVVVAQGKEVGTSHVMFVPGP